MTTPTGLRERKKQQTRRRIIDAALALFAERGFDRVRVADVARAAEVSEATVFNYFGTKEDLIYYGTAAFEAQLLDVIRTRESGTTVLQAFRDYVLEPKGALTASDPTAIEQIATAARIIADSPALQTREQQLADRATHALAELIADEAGTRPPDLDPWVVANALVGVNRAITRLIHRHALDGRSARAIARAVGTQGRRAFDLLESGLTR